MPRLSKSQHTFDHFSNHYGPYIDGEHFLGRSALDEFSRKAQRAPVKIQYEKDRCVIRVSLPDFGKDEVNLHFENDTFYLRAVKADKTSSSNKPPTANVNKTFSIPPNTDRDKIEVSFEKSVVEIVLPQKSNKSAMDIALN